MRSQSSLGKRVTRRLSAAVGVVCTVGLFLPMASASAQPKPLPPSSAAGAYTAVSPTRIADTRPASGEPNANSTLAPGGSVTVTLPATVPVTANAVALSVTAVDATQAGFLSVYPGAAATGATESVLNFVAGPPNCTTPNCVVPNLVVTQETGNQVTIANTNNTPGATGTVDVVVDLEGYFDPTNATTSGAGHYTALNPHRVIDTRCATSPPKPGVTAAVCSAENDLAANAGKGTVASNSTLNVATGLTGAAAAVVELTATNTTANGYLTAYSGTGTKPTASNVNFVAGQTTATRAIVPVGTDGSINVYNYNGSTDVAVDVVGSFSDTTGAVGNGALFTPITPVRVADTRTPPGTPIAQNTSRSFQITGANGIPASVNGQPTAAALNVTEASSDLGGFLTVTPNTITPPATTSDVNFDAGQVRANQDEATLNATGGISVYNYFGNTNVALDAFGYYTAASTIINQLSVTLSPTTGPAGTQVSATIVGAVNLTNVTVTGCGLTNLPLTAGSNGSYTFNIPTTAPAGACTLTFTGTSNGNTVSGTATFTVTTASSLTASVNPVSGPAGQLVTVTLTGAPNLTNVTVSGCGLTNQAVTAGSTPGTFTFNIPSPATLGACTLTFNALSNGSPVSGTAAFTITTGSGGGGGNGGNPSTNGPDLVSAKVITNGFPTGNISTVQYVFDKAINTATKADFSLLGFNVAHVQSGTGATAAFVDPSNPDAVDVQFPVGTNVANYTVASASNDSLTTGAVTGFGGGNLANPLGVVTLMQSTTSSGATAGPDLVSAAQAAPTQITYTFDKQVTGVTPGDFGYYDTSGTLHTGSSFVAPITTTNQVTVVFPTIITPSEAVVIPGAALTIVPPVVPNPEGMASLGATVLNPFVTSVVGGNAVNTFDFTFNRAVSPNAASLYHVYLDNGMPFSGMGVVNALSPTTVEVTFPGITQSNRGNVVLGTTSAGAATGTTSPGPAIASAISAQPIAPPAGGPTDGPFLTSVNPNAGANQATFNFNQALVGTPVAGKFFVLTSGDVPTFGTTAVLNGMSVTVTFAGGAVGGAVAGGVVGTTVAGAKTGTEFSVSGAGTINASLIVNAPGDLAFSAGTGGGPGSGGGTTTGTPPTTNGPDLLSAKVITNGFPTGNTSTVQYVFDKNVTLGTTALFSIQGYNRTHVLTGASSTTAFVDPSNAMAIDVQFPPTVNAGNFTLAVASNSSPTLGAANAAGGGNLANPLGAVPLTAAAPTASGATAGPDLVSAAQTSPTQITYTFDKQVLASGPAADFGYYNTAGAKITGASIATFVTNTNTVTVNFPAITGTAEAFVIPGAATNFAAGNPEGMASLGGTVANPFLTGVTAGSAVNTFDFTFNRPVLAPTSPGLFHVYLDNGTEFSGTGTVAQLSSTTVEVTFAAVTQANHGNVVLGTTSHAAATGVAPILPSAVSAQPIAPPTGGLADGPVLASAAKNTAASQVTYTFGTSLTGTPNATKFFVVTAPGVATFGTTAVLNGSTVTVTFPVGTVGSAVGAGVTGTTTGSEAGVTGTGVFGPSGIANLPGDVTLP